MSSKRVIALVLIVVLLGAAWTLGGRRDKWSNDILSNSTTSAADDNAEGGRPVKGPILRIEGEDTEDSTPPPTRPPQAVAIVNPSQRVVDIGGSPHHDDAVSSSPSPAVNAARPYEFKPNTDAWQGTADCPVNRSVDELPAKFSAKDFCAQFQEQPRRQPMTVWYGIMFSFELDMLEVLLHETSMVVDKYIVIESEASHSKKSKALYFGEVLRQERFQAFLPKIINGTFVARRRLRSGWDYEKRQRRRVLQVVAASGIKDGDLFIANLDLDEVFSRKTVMRYKFCATAVPVFHTFGFRYYLNCLQDESVGQYQRSIITWMNRDYGFYDLYRARSGVVQVPINPRELRQEMKKMDSQLVWHMSTFGTFDDIRFKLSHSPHRFVDALDDDTLRTEIDACHYNNRTRFKVDVYPDMLPAFIQRNLCHFQRLGWVRSVRTD